MIGRTHAEATPPNRARVARAVAFAMLALLVIATVPFASAQPQGGKTQTDVGPADFDWPLLTLNGERTSLAAFRGKVLVINHWATWCLPCLEELPSLAALRAAVPDSSIAFLLVSPQDRRRVSEFVRRRGIALPVFLEADLTPRAFGLEAVPTTWVVDRTGEIVLKRRGAMRWDTPELITLLRTLAATEPR